MHHTVFSIRFAFIKNFIYNCSFSHNHKLWLYNSSVNCWLSAADLAEHWKSSGQQLRMSNDHKCSAIVVKLSAGQPQHTIYRFSTLEILHKCEKPTSHERCPENTDLAAVCCWRHQWLLHRQALSPCGQSQRRDWCRSAHGECASTQRHRSWQTSFQDLSLTCAAADWRCRDWNHRVPVAAETNSKQLQSEKWALPLYEQWVKYESAIQTEGFSSVGPCQNLPFWIDLVQLIAVIWSCTLIEHCDRWVTCGACCGRPAWHHRMTLHRQWLTGICETSHNSLA